MGEALITRRGGIVWEKLTIEKCSTRWTDTNLMEGVWVVPLVLYNNDELNDHGMAVFVDGVCIYNDQEYYGTVTMSKDSNGYSISCNNKYSNYGLDTTSAYKLVT